MSFFLPANARRSTLNAQRSTFDLPRSGMTMVELVAALALFVLILGALLTILNTATSLWSSSRSQQQEQTSAENTASSIADDLYEAVTDCGVPTNTVFAKIKPTFLLSTPPSNSTPNQVVVVLGFARHASPRTYTDNKNAVRLSLDAVFYTYYKYALFRHAIPMSYTSYVKPETLGELLETARNKVATEALHDEILKSLSDPSVTPSSPGSYQLLAERAEIEGVATLPKNWVQKQGAGAETVSLGECGALALPDRLDLALRLYSQEDWETYQTLKLDNSESARLKKRHLGVLLTKRLTFPSKGGSRLP